MSIDRFDRRVVERKIEEGRSSREEYNKFLEEEVMTQEEFEQLSTPIDVQFIRRAASKTEDAEKSAE
jgi:hypothetical protein